MNKIEYLAGEETGVFLRTWIETKTQAIRFYQVTTFNFLLKTLDPTFPIIQLNTTSQAIGALQMPIHLNPTMNFGFKCRRTLIEYQDYRLE